MTRYVDPVTIPGIVVAVILTLLIGFSGCGPEGDGPCPPELEGAVSCYQGRSLERCEGGEWRTFTDCYSPIFHCGGCVPTGGNPDLVSVCVYVGCR